MDEQIKHHEGMRRLAVWLAAMSALVFPCAYTAPAGGVKAGGKVVSASRAPTRTTPTNRAKQRLAEERAMVQALAGKRDPFKLPPPPRKGGESGALERLLPPGARGLVIGQLRLKGIVREDADNTMIAVVMNGTNLAYFLRVHEEVYNGVVTKITPDAIYFMENSSGAGGRGSPREVVLKLGSTR